MPIKKEANGRRSIQVEVEVPGTPEEVWRAINTSNGISSWFVPTKTEERVGGKMTLTFAPGMDSDATITAWDPPRYSRKESVELDSKTPPMAFEWFVEAKAGGTCMVRVVQSLFADTDDWDNQLTGTESGWPTFFVILKLVLTHYRDQQVHAIHELSFTSTPADQAWDTLAAALDLHAAKVGEHRASKPGVPPVSGTVIQSGHAEYNQALLHLDQPAPGVAMIYAMPCGGPAMASVNFYLFGPTAAATVTRDQPEWRRWLDDRFPAAAAATP
jgi:uncharacterized protein YndB with AHSA1/START domain